MKQNPVVFFGAFVGGVAVLAAMQDGLTPLPGADEITLLDRLAAAIDRATEWRYFPEVSIAFLSLAAPPLLDYVWTLVHDWRAARELRRSALPTPKADVRKYAVDDYWKQIDEQAKVTVIASGKGGVGKSSIALGLLEYYSQQERVLLVDFDLHNRGLTSKFGHMLPKDQSQQSTLFAELVEFQSSVSSELRESLHEKLKGQERKATLGDITKAEFRRLRSKYCEDNGAPRDMHLAALPRARRNKGWIRPSSAFFLPSRYPDQEFIGSDISRMDFVEIALFIKYLACLARRGEQAITRIIVDCHGAHDMLSVGAIVAADHLVVTTTADPSAYEGTSELVEISKELARDKRFMPEAGVLVVNEYRRSERPVLNVMLEKMDVPFSAAPRIHYRNKIRRRLRNYRMPTIVRIPHMWKKMEMIARKTDPLRDDPSMVGKLLGLSSARIRKILVEQAAQNGASRFGEIVLNRGWRTESQLAAALEQQAKMRLNP